MSSERKTPKATGTTATDFNTAKASSRGLVADDGSARSRMFPSYSVVHSRSWPDALLSWIPDPMRYVSQRRWNAFLFSLVKFKCSLGRSSLRPRTEGGAGCATATGCVCECTLRTPSAPTTSRSGILNPQPGIRHGSTVTINDQDQEMDKYHSIISIQF